MKISQRAIATGAAVLFATTIFAPAPAFATSSVSWSQPTICPGETATVSINGVSDGSVVSFTAPEYFTMFTTSQPTPLFLAPGVEAKTSTFDNLSVYVGQTLTYQIVTATDQRDPSSITSVVSSASIEILAECVTATPEPETLANTGLSVATTTALALGAAVLGLGGAVLARRARRVASTK